MIAWLKGIGWQLLRAFGLGPKAAPFAWGTSVLPVADRSKIDALWVAQYAAVTGRGGKAAHETPEGLRYGVYQGDRFPDGSSVWGKYWKHSRVIVVLKQHERNSKLWSHECRHDVLGTEDHPASYFNGSSLELP